MSCDQLSLLHARQVARYWALLLPCGTTRPTPCVTLCMRSHAIVSTLVGPEYYVNIMSFVDKGQLEPGCSILLHNKVHRPGPSAPAHVRR